MTNEKFIYSPNLPPIENKMVSKKLKIATVIASVTVLGILTGCGPDNPEYNFSGKIGDEYVKFYERGDMGQFNYLEVVRPDGKKLVYRDISFNDLKIEELEIITEEQSRTFDKKNYPEVIAEAQKRFDEYLRKIKGIKPKLKEMEKEEALEILKKNPDKQEEENKGVYAD